MSFQGDDERPFDELNHSIRHHHPNENADGQPE